MRLLPKCLRLCRWIITEIADKLGFPGNNAEQKKQLYKAALKKHGVVDRPSLLDKSTRWFSSQDFSPFGKGIGFASTVLGRKVPFISSDILRELADELDLPDVPEDIREDHKILQYILYPFIICDFLKN